MASNKSIATTVAIFGEAYRQKVSDATMEAYRIGIGDLPEEDFARAVSIALHTSKFFPSPAELREYVGQKPESVAQKAWLAVEKAASIGAYRHVDFADPLINAAIRSIGGWPQILTRSGDEWAVWTRKTFIEAYESFSRGGVSADACGPLAGLAEGEVCNGQLCDAVEPIRIEVGYELPEVSRIATLERKKASETTDTGMERLRLGVVRKLRKLDTPDCDRHPPQKVPETIG